MNEPRESNDCACADRKEQKPWLISASARVVNASAWVVWAAALLVVNARAVLLSYRGTSFGTYNTAGWHWMRGEDVYSHWMGFVYGPIVAAFFAASTWVLFAVGNILWQLLNGVILLAGVRAVLKVNLFPGIDQQYSGIVYLLLVPLAIGKYRYRSGKPFGRRSHINGDCRRPGSTLEQRGYLRRDRHSFQALPDLDWPPHLSDRTQAFRLAIAGRRCSAPGCSIPIQPLVVCMEPISCMDCHESLGESTQLADREVALEED